MRLVHGISGSVTMSSEVVLRFEYGSAVPWVEALDDGPFGRFAVPRWCFSARPFRIMARITPRSPNSSVCPVIVSLLCLATAPSRHDELVHVWTPERHYRIPRPGVPGRINMAAGRLTKVMDGSDCLC